MKETYDYDFTVYLRDHFAKIMEDHDK